MHLLPAIGGALILLGLGMGIKSYRSNASYSFWLCVLAGILVTQGMIMLGVI